MATLKIDPEFRDKIPPMPVEDFEGLKADILRDGYVRDPLVVWEEENILLDGHHRWKVIQENPELPYTIDYKSFPDRWGAIAWICANQLHKHNMTEFQRMKLYQEEYEARQKSVTNATGRNQYSKEVGEEILHQPNENLIDGSAIPFEYKTGKEPKTREILAKEHNVSPGTIQTAVEVGRGIDKAAEVDPDFKRDVLSGVVKAKKSDLAAIRKLESPDEIQEAVDAIRSGRTASKPLPQSKEMKEFTDKINSVVKAMEDDNREYTIDDAITDFGSAEDTFFMQVRFIIQERQSVINTERGKEELIYFIDTMIKELNELKKEVE